MATLIIKVDAKEAERVLKRLNKSMDNTGKTATKSFDKAGASLGAIAGPIGVATAGVAALSAAFVALTVVATKAFIDITKEGITLNKEAELTRLSLIAIFEGNEKAADAFIDRIGELAIRLGTSRQELTQLGKGILPDVGSIKGTTDLLENVILLGRDAGQSIQSIRIATEEALSGNLSSLGRRLNIPRSVLDRIEEYNKTMSLASAINKGLAGRILETGISADVTADSFVALQGEIEGANENFKRLLGESPFQELKEQARDFLTILDEQSETIGFAAEAFGDLAANVIDFIGTNVGDFIASINFEEIEILVDAFNRALLAGRLVIDILFQIPDTEDGIRQLTIALTKIQEALQQVAKFADEARIALQASFNFAQIFAAFQKGDIEGITDALADLRDLASDESQARSAENAAQAFSDYEERVKSLNKAQRNRRDTTDKATQADIDAGEAILDNKRALDELADAQTAAAKAQEEISKKTTEFEEDQAERLTKFLKKEVDRRIDDELKAAQQRENIALNNTQAIESIFLRNRQAIADVDLTAEEEEIALKGARERRDIERNSANERVGIERNFRQELKRIRDQFNQDAEDAERNNDAQAFLRASRARDQQVDEAKVSRDESLVDVDVRAKEQRAELKIQLKNEVEDARSANAEKIASLQNRLDQELERQALKNKQDIEQQDIKERQLSDRRDVAFKRDIAALEQAELEKQAKLNESLEKQFALLEAAKTKEIEVTAQAEAQKTAIVEAEVAKRRIALAAQAAAQEQAGAGALPLAPTRGGLGANRPFQLGGRPPVGRAITVGEDGPEIFVPDTAGTIIPNNAIFSPPAQPSLLTQMSSSVTNNSPTFNLAENMFQDPIARRNLTNFMLGVLAERI